MLRIVRTVSAVLGASALTLGFSGIAGANQATHAIDSQQVKVEVAYTDLDLARTEDAHELYSRIERAAYNLCFQNYGPSTAALQRQRACAGKAVDEAVQSVGNANLTAVYVAKTGKRPMVASSR
jgi:UrcA family protein